MKTGVSDSATPQHTIEGDNTASGWNYHYWRYCSAVEEGLFR